ncbi:serine-rich adhesin for platelets-like [Folsomia candida]|uniref:serine-rich adhesin for platelets-like n=1 Tax=Folsomia candida TaxID=158441 RepID=UPI000B907CB4|nr:serine-rich adhesin for platelets-like [Folsomia candida]
MPSCKAKKRPASQVVKTKPSKSKKSDKNNNSNSQQDHMMDTETLKKLKNYEKYSLRPRSIQNRIETEKRQKLEPKKQPKPKQKPPPLSKYRRKTANARERNRMREINTAFDCLQKVVPAYPILPVNAQGKTCEKLTKITTLRLAMDYIQTLSTLLNDDSEEIPSSSSDLDLSFLTAGLLGNGSVSSSVSNYSESSISGGGGSLSSTEFSPASSSSSSSYALSPLSPAGPECFQTVMRSSALSPTATNVGTTAMCSNAANFSQQLQMCANPLNNSVMQQTVLLPVVPSSSIHGPTIATSSPPPVLLKVHHDSSSPILPSSQNCSSISISPPLTSNCSSKPGFPSAMMSLSLSANVNAFSHKTFQLQSHAMKLPPISTSLSSALIRKSMSTFAADCAQLTSGFGDSLSNFYITSSSGSGNRTGSLSSLTESDLSEYASDLLSDEGSTFDDIIGVGVGTDLELLLQNDTVGEALSF